MTSTLRTTATRGLFLMWEAIAPISRNQKPKNLQESIKKHHRTAFDGAWLPWLKLRREMLRYVEIIGMINRNSALRGKIDRLSQGVSGLAFPTNRGLEMMVRSMPNRRDEGRCQIVRTVDADDRACESSLMNGSALATIARGAGRAER